MKKVYFVNVKDSRVIEGELDTESHSVPLKKIDTIGGAVYVPPTMKLWDSKSDLLVSEFARCFKSVGTFEGLAKKYHLDNSEAKIYLDDALKRYPEKFI